MIGIFSISDLPGGAEQVLKQIARYYISKGIPIHYYIFRKKSTHYYEDLDSDLFKIIYFNNSPLSMLFYFLRSDVTYDRVFSSLVPMNAIVGKLIQLKIIKTNRYIVREPSSVFLRTIGLKYKFAYFFGYNKIDLLITQTDVMKDLLIKKVPYLKTRTKIKTLKNPFAFPISSQQNDISVFDAKEFIVAAGRLIPEKGFDILIRSFKNIKEKHPFLKLILLGEGKMRKELEKLIKELYLINEVILLGFVPDVYPYFKKAKACVVSSRVEGFPNVLLQMMSQNERIVSTTCAGDIKNIPGLFLAEPKNQESLEKTMNKALDPNEIRDKSNYLFLDYLKERTIENYISVIDHNLKNKAFL